jgi:hypothetical protein
MALQANGHRRVLFANDYIAQVLVLIVEPFSVGSAYSPLSAEKFF